MLGDMNVSKIAKKGILYTQTGTPYYARFYIFLNNNDFRLLYLFKFK